MIRRIIFADQAVVRIRSKRAISVASTAAITIAFLLSLSGAAQSEVFHDWQLHSSVDKFTNNRACLIKTIGSFDFTNKAKEYQFFLMPGRKSLDWQGSGEYIVADVGLIYGRRHVLKVSKIRVGDRVFDVEDNIVSDFSELVAAFKKYDTAIVRFGTDGTGIDGDISLKGFTLAYENSLRNCVSKL